MVKRELTRRLIAHCEEAPLKHASTDVQRIHPAEITVFAPATVANLGVGFDILGMALESPGDEITASHRATPGVEIIALSGDGGRLPTDPDRNTAGIAARETLKLLGAMHGVCLTIKKGLPLASGLGSSAASAAGAAVAVNLLFGEPLSTLELLPACVEAEAAVSGRHADNVAPARLVCIVLLTGKTVEDVYRLPVPDNRVLALVTPDVAVPTQQARALLPSTIALSEAVHQNAFAAALIHALHTNDLQLMARCMEQDTIITPARASLMPGLDAARQAAHEAGALAAIISGAGPTICAFCESELTSAAVCRAFEEVYEDLNIACQTHVTRPSQSGTTSIVRQGTTLS